MENLEEIKSKIKRYNHGTPSEKAELKQELFSNAIVYSVYFVFLFLVYAVTVMIEDSMD